MMRFGDTPRRYQDNITQPTDLINKPTTNSVADKILLREKKIPGLQHFTKTKKRKTKVGIVL